MGLLPDNNLEHTHSTPPRASEGLRVLSAP